MIAKLPAMRGTIGQREYYSTLMKLKVLPRMFTYTDWAEFSQKDREQRTLNRKRIPAITRYMTENEDGYLFASITASYKCPVRFVPSDLDPNLGTLEMDFDDAAFVINDGQHRAEAIREAIKTHPVLGEETISVLLFPYENKARTQQMFSDLNRNVVKTSKSLDVLFDHRDLISRVTSAVIDLVPAFKEQVETEAVSLPLGSTKMFSLAALYDANKEFLVGDDDDSSENELIAKAVEYWIAIARHMPDWERVRKGKILARELRQESIASHSVVLRALGAVGAELLRNDPKGWKDHLQSLEGIDWKKSNREWEGVNIVANSVVSNRQARAATKAYLKQQLGLQLTDSELRSLTPASSPVG